MAVLLSPSFMSIIEGLFWLPVALLAAGLLMTALITLIAHKLINRRINREEKKNARK